ncbi:MAG: phosphate signaling complex protein PhoU [Candidatus Odinarchaeia archaeon]
MSRIKYTQQLERLKQDLIKMGNLARDSFKFGVAALVDRDRNKAEKVGEINKEIDDLEFKIEKLCVKLLALQQPVGEDLRFITTAMKIITDFDRIGDLSNNIAVVVLRSIDKPLVKPLIDIPRMRDIADEMIKEILKCLSNGDLEKLKECGKKDDIVDALHEQIYRELITMMIENPRIISDATDLLLVSRYLERIADHACNISARIIYMRTGKRIKLK